mgnify:CR=1 FL=1
MSEWWNKAHLSLEEGLRVGFHPGYEVLCRGRWIWNGHGWDRSSLASDNSP